jgi:hypothetical protein
MLTLATQALDSLFFLTSANTTLYGSRLRREVEQLLATTPQEVAEDKLNNLRAEMDKLAEDAPSVSEKIWARTKKTLYEPQDRTTAA